MNGRSKGEPKPSSAIQRPNNAGLIKIAVEYRPVADLVLDPRNPRQHSQRQIDQIADSIREFDFVMPIAVNHRQQVVIGHARVLAAKKLKMSEIPVVEIGHLSKAQLTALRIADNKLAQNANWDERLLGENFLELKELDINFDLTITGFCLPEIDLTLQSIQAQAISDTDDEVESAVTGVSVCQPGDVWHLGAHRLYCGELDVRDFLRHLDEGRTSSRCVR